LFGKFNSKTEVLYKIRDSKRFLLKWEISRFELNFAGLLISGTIHHPYVDPMMNLIVVD